MTDPDLVRKKLAFVAEQLKALRDLGRPDLLDTDLREQYFVEHALQLAIQAVLDVSSHIVSDERLGEPERNRDLFALLARGGWLTPTLAGALERMAGFRNVIVHDYAAVDLAIVRAILERHLGDLEAFAHAIYERLDETSGC